MKTQITGQEIIVCLEKAANRYDEAADEEIGRRGTSDYMPA